MPMEGRHLAGGNDDILEVHAGRFDLDLDLLVAERGEIVIVKVQGVKGTRWFRSTSRGASLRLKVLEVRSRPCSSR